MLQLRVCALPLPRGHFGGALSSRPRTRSQGRGHDVGRGRNLITSAVLDLVEITAPERRSPHFERFPQLSTVATLILSSSSHPTHSIHRLQLPEAHTRACSTVSVKPSSACRSPRTSSTDPPSRPPSPRTGLWPPCLAPRLLLLLGGASGARIFHLVHHRSELIACCPQGDAEAFRRARHRLSFTTACLANCQRPHAATTRTRASSAPSSATPAARSTRLHTAKCAQVQRATPRG